MDAWTSVQSDEPLLQGDIIRWHNARSRSPAEDIGIIVNADCDVLHGKTGQTLTYIPILSFSDYAAKVWYVEKLSALFDKYSDNLSARILKLHQQSNPNAQPIRRDDLIDICHAPDIERLITTIAMNSDEQSKLRDAIELYLKMAKLLTKSPITTISEEYCQLHCDALGGKLAQIKTSTHNTLVTHIKNSEQHDVFFISSLPKIDGGPFVATLRLFRTVETTKVCTTQADWYKNSNNAFRIGRIIPELRYGLIQRFSNLFVRIGMPSKYERHRDELLSSLQFTETTND